MRVRSKIAMALAICIMANAVVMGTGVLCIELGGHTLVERIFDCLAGGGCPSEKAGCDPCVDIPVQTTGDQIQASRPSDEAGPFACAAVVERIAANCCFSPDLICIGQTSINAQSVPVKSIVLRC